mmetsp:Transcript_14791/g.34947  ORF Transcript_14791/g.34947 Transcript_14791/m.34947 type:complete len:243 (-) Transcript_14791:104-832(-)
MNHGPIAFLQKTLVPPHSPRLVGSAGIHPDGVTRLTRHAIGHLQVLRAASSLGPSKFRSCKAVHARPPAAVFAGRGHGVAAARKDGTHALVGVRWLIMHVELKVSAPFECGALHCASSAVHRAIVHTLRSDGFCGRWLIPGPQATSHSAAAAGPYQLTSRELRGLQGGSCAPAALLPTAAHAPAPGDVVRVRRTRVRKRPLTVAAGLRLVLLHRAGGGGCRDDVHHDHHNEDIACSAHRRVV